MPLTNPEPKFCAASLALQATETGSGTTFTPDKLQNSRCCWGKHNASRTLQRKPPLWLHERGNLTKGTETLVADTLSKELLF